MKRRKVWEVRGNDGRVSRENDEKSGREVRGEVVGLCE